MVFAMVIWVEILLPATHDTLGVDFDPAVLLSVLSTHSHINRLYIFFIS